MKTTIRKLYKYGPCSDGFAQLIYSVTGRKEPPETDISDQFSLLTEDEKNREIGLIEILESNGIEHAAWALRCFDYKYCCLFLADVAESVLPVFEADYPEDDRPRRVIQAVRDYHGGKIDAEELRAAAKDAYAAGEVAERAAVKAAAKDVCAAGEAAERAAVKAAVWAAWAAWAAAGAAAGEAVWAAWAAEDAAARDAARAAAGTAKWQEIESLFRKHFGGKDENNH